MSNGRSKPDLMNIAIFSVVPFPFGTAASTRTRSLALGLQEAGGAVTVIALPSVGSPLPQNDGPLVPQHWRGITCYLNWRSGIPEPPKSSSIARNLANRLLKGRNVAPFIGEALGFLDDVCAKEKRFDLIILYNQDWKLGRSLAALCRRYSIAFVQSFSERHTPADYKLGVLEPHFLREYFHFFLIPRYCDGAVVISTGLKNMLPKYLHDRTVVVPAMTNTESGGGSIDRKLEKNIFQVAYFGGGNRRENPKLLIDAAAILLRTFPHLRLVLFGLLPEVLSHLTEEVSRKHLENTVRLRGRVKEEELRELFGATDVFVLPRISDFSAQCSFPTRLPELLLTGAPVIVSNVGDVGLYLEDTKSAIFLRKGTSEELVEKIVFLIANPEIKESIGSCGRTVVDNCFSYRKWGDEVLSFFQTNILGGPMENEH